MALLAEYALTPDVFDTTSYSNGEVCGLHLQSLKDVLLHEGLVRNLRDGEWATLFASDQRPWHMRAKELLKKLATQKRLVPFDPALAAVPISDDEWCKEALAAHKIMPLSGIIVTDGIAGAYAKESLVAPVHRLSSTPWWTSRSPSLRLGRTLADYQAALSLVLHHANHVMFVDPHVDPGEQRYKDLITLIQGAGDKYPKPLIEVHRVCYRGSGASRRILDLAEVEATFRSELAGPLNSAGLSVEVFIWDDFHDRYLISHVRSVRAFCPCFAGVCRAWPSRAACGVSGRG